MSTTRPPDSAALKPRSVVHVGAAFYLSSPNELAITTRERLILSCLSVNDHPAKAQ